MKVRKSNSESKIVLLPNLWKYVCKSIKIYKRGGEIVAEDQSKVFEAAQENMKKTVVRILGLVIAIILISQHLQVFAVTAEQRKLLVELAKTMNEQPPIKKRGIFG